MTLNIIGIMSGTSLDGLDIALCEFDDKNYAEFKVIKAKTYEIPANLKAQIRNVLNLSVIEFVGLHKKFGEFIGLTVNKFLEGQQADLIASHGQTVVHLPEQKLNFQIGAGSTIAVLTGIPAVCDFRSNDIDLGGQGAPLVPVGEKFLFPDFDGFLNIGGFSNITKINKKIIAYDISPANFALNFFARKFNKEYDKDGKIGQQGTVNQALLNNLNSLDYYSQNPPKSLSDHWFYDYFLKKINNSKINDTDKLRTIYEHIAFQIAQNINKLHIKKLLITGGGAFNKFLINLIKTKTSTEIIIPEKNIVEFKESIIFAFLGLLRYQGKNNCLASVTGAKSDNIGGAIYLPPK